MTSTRHPFHTLLATALLILPAAPLGAQRGPAPKPTNLSPEVLALACAPTIAFELPPTPLRVTGGQDSAVRRIFQPGDLVTINAGTDNGIAVGHEFYVRRVQAASGRAVGRESPGVVRTAGWIRVYAVDDRLSLATISHACDTIEINDYLESFVLPEVPAASANRPKAQRDNYGRIVIGTDRRASFGRGDFIVVDRGSDHGVTAGAQFVIYRDRRQDENFLYDLGEAVAMNVTPETSTLLVTISRDAMAAGDYVAIRK
jgi:hypothetical protein